MGVVSSLGNDLGVFWRNLVSGKSGISEVMSFDTTAFDHHFGGEVRNFDPNVVLSPSEVRVFGRATQFSVAATTAALIDAGLYDAVSEIATHAGVVIGTTFGEAQIVEDATKVFVNGRCDVGKRRPMVLKQYNPNSLSVNVARKFGFCGPNMVIPTACAAGNYAIAYAASLIEIGRADVMIAGGADPFSHVSFSGFSRLGVMASEKCQPFDKNRKGMLVGEGAGMMVLEDYEFAKRRGVRIYGEVLSYGLSCDANHMTIPEVGGIVAVMEKAVKNAGVHVKDVDYVCAHGTGTLVNDKTECLAIRKVFYERGNKAPVSSIKSMLGHTMGAASALEAIASILAIKEGEIPPTINYRTPDPECDVDCVPNESRTQKVEIVLNNSFAFGGNNACLVLSGV
jgi:3-oxoacyl-[acyl-carrier-protein] synthase II